MFRILMGLFVLSCSCLTGFEPLSFSEISDAFDYWQTEQHLPDSLLMRQGEQVEIKGFLYQQASTSWILSDRPNLRTCCMGKSDLAGSQVVLEGDFAHDNSSLPVDIAGIFHVEWSERHSPTFKILNAGSIQAPASKFPWTTIGLLLTGVIFAVIYSSKFVKIKKP